MGVNTKKYEYINRVGLVKGSWALQMFQADAELHHMLDQPGKLVALRLTEYYELKESMKVGGGAATIAITQPATQQPVPAIIDDDEDEDDAVPPAEENDLLGDIENQWD